MDGVPNCSRATHGPVGGPQRTPDRTRPPLAVCPEPRNPSMVIFVLDGGPYRVRQYFSRVGAGLLAERQLGGARWRGSGKISGIGGRGNYQTKESCKIV